MPKDAGFYYFHKAFAKLGYTVFSICEGRLITDDHWILIGCNTLLRVSSCSVTAIKRAIKIFSPARKWSICIAHLAALPSC